MYRKERICRGTGAALAMTAIMMASALTSCGNRKELPVKTPVVKTETVKAYGDEARIEFPGRVTASSEVNMAFQIPGTLKRIYAREGAAVRQGEVIAELDDRDYKVQLAAAKAEYDNIKADAERVFALYRDSAVTASAYDKARYGLEQITAKLENCRNQLADTKLAAPFDGRIQKTYYDAPAVVGAGMPVISLISGGAPEIEINIPGSEYARFREYSSFEATFDFLDGMKAPLKMLSISPKANANQLYTVRLGLPSAVSGVAPGMNTMVRISTKPADDGRACIPSSALFSKDGESHVWILSGDNTVSSREVKVGSLHTDGSAVILSGIDPGETVITSGTHQIREGERVKILEKASSTNIGGLL